MLPSLSPLWLKLALIPLVGWATVLTGAGLIALTIAWKRWFPND